MSNDPAQNQHPGLSRRTLVQGAAWSVPVIAVANAAPAHAASPPPCTPSTSQSLASWGVNNAWPENNNPNCGQHADIVFIFGADQTCGATQFEVVMGLPGSNDSNDRGAIWIWAGSSPANRQHFGYLINTSLTARTEGGIAIPAASITVPKYRSSPAATYGWRDARGTNTVNDGIHVAMYNRTGGGSSGCQRVTGWDFTWYWRERQPAVGTWHQMTSRLNLPTVGNPSLSAPTFVGYNTPLTYTSLG